MKKRTHEPLDLILASTSPRRKEILSSLGLPFTAVSPKFEEIPQTQFSAKEEVCAFAEGKARSVSDDYAHAVIIGSDTLIEYQGEKIGKPGRPEKASETLSRLQGQTHHIWTAVFLLDTSTGQFSSSYKRIEVRLHEISSDDIRDYVDTGEPLDKAGAYSVQGIGKKFIASLKGDRLAAIGMPLDDVTLFLEERAFKINT